MKAKKVSVIMLAVGFFLATIFSCIFVFSVRKVETSFAVSNEYDTVKMQNQLNKFNGKNLLFLNLDDVYSVLNQDRYLKVLEVKKSFPNVINVSLEQRIGVFYLQYQDKYYLLDDSGFVLEEYSFEQYSQIAKNDNKKTISINAFNNVVENGEVVSVEDTQIVNSKPNIAKKIDADENGIIYTALAMAKEVRLTDCIKHIKISRLAELNYVIFYTYSGVEILVENIVDRGVDKILEAFSLYDNEENDYKKSFGKIHCFTSLKEGEEGKIDVTWTDKFPDEYKL